MSIPSSSSPRDGIWTRPFDLAHCAFVDFELTGLTSESNSPIEVAVVHWREGAPVVAFESLIRPTSSLDPAASLVHGIPDTALATAPSLDTVRDPLREALAHRVVVAHGANVEREQLRRIFDETREPSLELEFVVDTITLARRALRLANYRLSTVCESLGFSQRRWHRAAADALATAELTARLVAMYAPRDARDLWQVRVGQQGSVTVRDAIIEQLSHAHEHNLRVNLTARASGKNPRNYRGKIELLSSPHVRLVSAQGAVHLLRADRILRIEPCDEGPTQR
ncbi:MAG: 3'-5' exonuclease [Deltaproteobacteria bacterium]|nr:3'-5' exonuclease [Deltaproteobacteria bacterium]